MEVGKASDVRHDFRDRYQSVDADGHVAVLSFVPVRSYARPGPVVCSARPGEGLPTVFDLADGNCLPGICRIAAKEGNKHGKFRPRRNPWPIRSQGDRVRSLLLAAHAAQRRANDDVVGSYGDSA